MRGYVLPGAKSLGSISQPCTRVAPFIQFTLRISPHAGLISSLSLVTCIHLPIGPNHTSGGALGDCRTTALIGFSPAEELARTQESPSAAADSSPVHRVLGLPPLILTLPKLEFPSLF